MIRDIKDFIEDFRSAKSIWLKLFFIALILSIIVGFYIWDIHLAEPFRQRMAQINIPYITELKSIISTDKGSKVKKKAISKTPQLRAGKPATRKIIKVADLKYGDIKKAYTNRALKLSVGNKSISVFYKYKFDDYDDSTIRSMRFSDRGIRTVSLFGSGKALSANELLKEGNSLPFCLNKKMYQLDVLNFNDQSNKFVVFGVNKVLNNSEFECI